MSRKQQKEFLFKKYNGKCAFCGTNLKKGVFISPIMRPRTWITSEGEITITGDGIAYKLPACKSCYGIREQASSKEEIISIERFRKVLQQHFEFLQEDTKYQRSLRFGLIKETKQSIVFYFEKAKLTHPDENL